jgi:hypothetical protein
MKRIQSLFQFLFNPRHINIFTIIFSSILMICILLSLFYPDKGVILHHTHRYDKVTLVDVPEEINTISHDSSNPSSLDAYIIGGILYLRIPPQQQLDTVPVIQHISYIKN